MKLAMKIGYYELPDLIYCLGGKATYTQIKYYLKKKFGISVGDGIRHTLLNSFIEPYIAIVRHVGDGIDTGIHFDFYFELNKEKYERVLKENGIERLTEKMPKSKPMANYNPYAKPKKDELIRFEKDKHIIKAIIYYKFGIKKIKKFDINKQMILSQLDYSQPLEIVE
ncbi:MAG: hypothetical protein ACP5G1_04075 [Nanopusillaceae archaeon]